MSFFSCCVGSINYNLDELDESSQILPKKQSINDKNELYPNNNLLFSYGYNSYGNVIDLNKLIDKSNTTLKVKQMCFGENHTLMLIETLDDDKINETFLFGCGSNSNGQLGLEYIPNNKNEYENFEEINLSDYINQGLFFWNKIKFIIDSICVGNDFSLVFVKYPNSENSTLYRFELLRNDRF
jgi:alpha-tubulin suppressor-like RCC1 family protein